MTPRRAPSWRPVLAAAIAAPEVAGVGALATDLGPWYQSLRKPSWQPPEWLFGPVWTLVFGLAAFAGASAWSRAQNRALRRRLIALFARNALLNVLRSVLFFRLQRPEWRSPRSVVLLMVVVAPHPGRRHCCSPPLFSGSPSPLA